MPEYSLQRSGSSPLAFTGDLITEAKGDPAAVRWHELRLYRTAGGKFVLELVYRSTFESHKLGLEPSYSFVEVCDSPQAVQDAVRAHRGRLADLVVGYPLGVQQYAKKQDRLMRQVHGDFDAAASRLLADPLFAERLD